MDALDRAKLASIQYGFHRKDGDNLSSAKLKGGESLDGLAAQHLRQENMDMLQCTMNNA
jgi:hypothetical protein